MNQNMNIAKHYLWIKLMDVNKMSFIISVALVQQ